MYKHIECIRNQMYKDSQYMNISNVKNHLMYSQMYKDIKCIKISNR